MGYKRPSACLEYSITELFQYILSTQQISVLVFKQILTFKSDMININGAKLKWIEAFFFFVESITIAVVQCQNTTTTILSADGLNISIGSSSNCDDHSLWEESCGVLNYTGPHCRKAKDGVEWACLKKRALMANHQSCKCHDKNRGPKSGCEFIEFCVFVLENFHCKSRYNCTPMDDQRIFCQENDEGDSFFVNCTRSLLYLPTKHIRDLKLIETFQRLFREQCADQYEGEFLRHNVWYYVDRVLFNNINDPYSSIYPIRSCSGLDSQLPCENDSKLDDDMRNLWKYIVVILAVFAIVVGTGYALWRWKQHEAVKDKIWQERLDQCIAQQKFIFDDVATEMEQSQPTPDEKIDKFFPGDIPLRAQKQVDSLDLGRAAVIDSKLNTEKDSVGADWHTHTPTILLENMSYVGVNLAAAVESGEGSYLHPGSVYAIAPSNASTVSDKEHDVNIPSQSNASFDGYSTKNSFADSVSIGLRTYTTRLPSVTSGGDENTFLFIASNDGGKETASSWQNPSYCES